MNHAFGDGFDLLPLVFLQSGHGRNLISAVWLPVAAIHRSEIDIVRNAPWDLMNRVEAAVACGISVIAEGARYRDGHELASIGVELAMRPSADA